MLYTLQAYNNNAMLYKVSYYYNVRLVTNTQ